jgi:hypothetical protein
MSQIVKSVLGDPDRIQLVWQAGSYGLVSANGGAVVLADKNFEITGTNVVSGNCTYDGDHGLKFTTQSAAADQVIMEPSTAGDDSGLFREITWSTRDETKFECLFRTDVLEVTGVIMIGMSLGLSSPFVVGDKADQAVFRWLNGTDTTWKVNNSIGSTDTTADTGVAVVASSVYLFQIEFDANRRCRYYINGNLVHTSLAHSADVDLLPVVGIQEGSTNPLILHLRALAMSRKLAA